MGVIIAWNKVSDRLLCQATLFDPELPPSWKLNIVYESSMMALLTYQLFLTAQAFPTENPIRHTINPIKVRPFPSSSIS